MIRFTTTVEDEHGTEHDVIVVYNWIRPIPATRDDPPEGGCEIVDIISPITLTKEQAQQVVDDCNAYAWDVWRNGK